MMRGIVVRRLHYFVFVLLCETRESNMNLKISCVQIGVPLGSGLGHS
jgi:hypothetical protein